MLRCSNSHSPPLAAGIVGIVYECVHGYSWKPDNSALLSQLLLSFAARLICASASQQADAVVKVASSEQRNVYPLLAGVKIIFELNQPRFVVLL